MKVFIFLSVFFIPIFIFADSYINHAPLKHSLTVSVSEPVALEEGKIEPVSSVEAEKMKTIYKGVEDSIVGFRLNIIELANQKVSKESLADWYLTINNLNRKAFDFIQTTKFMKDSTKAKRIAMIIVNSIVSFWLSNPLLVIGHEKSHAEAAESFGVDEISYGHTAYPNREMSLGTLFLILLRNPGRGNAYTKTDKKNLSHKELTALSAAGLNYQMVVASKLVNQNIKNERTHAVDTTYLLNTKMAIGIYYTTAGNDLKEYVNGLVEQGHIEPGSQNQVIKKLAKLNLLTAFLSGSVINSFQAYSQYIENGDPSEEIITFDTGIGRVTWPEFEVFLNAVNITLKSYSYVIRENGAIYQIGYETPLEGDRDGEELSFGSYRKLNDKWDIEGVVRYNTKSRSYGGSFELGYDLNEHWRLLGGLDYERGKNDGTWAGQRRHSSVDGGKDIASYLLLQLRF